MPPMPTKWIVPMSVPSAFHAGTPPAGERRGCALCGAGPTCDGASPSPMRSTRSARSRAACGRPTDSARAAALASACGSAAIASIWRASTSRGELVLRDRPRAAGLGHFARIGGLVVVGRRRQRDQDRRPARGGQLGDRRGAGAGDDQMRLGELVRHVLDIGHQLGRDAELGVARADPLDVVGAALLDDLQAAAKRRLEQRQPFGNHLAEHVAPWLPPVIRISAAQTRRSRERHLAELGDRVADRIADDHVLAAWRGFRRSTWS